MSSKNEQSSNGTKPKISMTLSDDKSFDVWVQGPNNLQPTKVPRTDEEIEKAFPIQFPRNQAPEPPLPQAEVDLYEKAVNNPASLTEDEKIRIRDWVSEATADERCRMEFAISWQELVQKAVERPANLTRDEIMFLKTGRHTTYKDSDADMNRVSRILGQPELVMKLWSDSQKAAADPVYTVAMTNASKEDRRISRERREGLSHLSDDDRWNIDAIEDIPWIERIKTSPKPYWGLVCIRSSYEDDEAWTKYREHILRSSMTGLWASSCPDSVSAEWKIHFIEDDMDKLEGASLEDICKYFKDLPTASIPAGLRDDAFLFADAHTISSLGAIYCDPWPDNVDPAPHAPPRNTEHLLPGYAKVVDASYSPSKSYEHGFGGILKVHPAHISTSFFQRLLPRGVEKGQEQWWKSKQSWETMYMRANGRNCRAGGVYPPLGLDKR